ncbi:MAG: hypothetical protein E7652_00970 [Ruminococcaceae bacterium]|nr:hypothetical protein [Oscillospiraceae bacterium]
MDILEILHISDLWTADDSTLAKVIWAFYIGIVIASVVMWFTQKVLGRAVRTLLKKEIFSVDRALSLDEADINTFFIRRALKNKYSAMRKVVYCTVDKEKLTKEDWNEAKFYIPEEQKYKADVKYHGRNTSIGLIIITAVVMFIVAILCIEYIPMLLDLFKQKGN